VGIQLHENSFYFGLEVQGLGLLGLRRVKVQVKGLRLLDVFNFLTHHTLGQIYGLRQSLGFSLTLNVSLVKLCDLTVLIINLEKHSVGELVNF